MHFKHGCLNIFSPRRVYEDYKVGCPEPNPGTPDDSSNEESSSDSDDAHDQQEDFL